MLAQRWQLECLQQSIARCFNLRYESFTPRNDVMETHLLGAQIGHFCGVFRATFPRGLPRAFSRAQNENFEKFIFYQKMCLLRDGN